MFPRRSPQTVCPQCAGALYVRYDLAHCAAWPPARKLHGPPRTPPWKGLCAIAAFCRMWRLSRWVKAGRRCSTAALSWCLCKGRRRQPHRKLQGARPGAWREHGSPLRLEKLAVPSAGNAAGALAADAAAAGIEANIFMPKDVPFANYVEATMYGAKVYFSGRPDLRLRPHGSRAQRKRGWFDISTLKEPFRIEGKKTMGYELVEQLGWEYPAAVFYPTGGGVGLIGMWKAFGELEELGWVKPGKRPK